MPPMKCKACGEALIDEEVMKPRSINIFLVDGHPNGTRIAQISMSTIQAIAFPRNQLSRVRSDFSEISRPGVYILIGYDEDGSGQMVAYIGQSESVAKRLGHHNSAKKSDGTVAKDFWESTIVLISKDDNLTSAHARFVEARLIAAAASNPHWSIDKNTQRPEEAGALPLSERVAMEEFIDQTKTLVGALGCDIFRVIISQASEQTPSKSASEATSTVDDEVFRMNGQGYSATMTLNQAGEFVVRKGSRARLTTTPSIPKSTANLRNVLIKQQVLTATAETYVFSTDYHFTSVSAAAATVIGGAANGRIIWKLADGRTYAEWESGGSEEIADDISAEDT